MTKQASWSLPWRERFARKGVWAFTATTSGLCALAAPLLVVACTKDVVDEPQWYVDAAFPPPPGTCVVMRSPTPFCEAGVEVDAGDVDAEFVEGDGGEDGGEDEWGAPDAGAVDADVELAPPESENRCLVTSDVTIDCSSYVGDVGVVEGRNGATEVLVSQLGHAHYASPTNPTLVPDTRAHVQHVHIDADGSSRVTLDPIEPFETVPRDALGGSRLSAFAATSTRDAQLVLHTSVEEQTSELRWGALGEGAVTLGAPLALPVGVRARVSSFTGKAGESFFFAQARGGELVQPTAEPLVVVRGLPDEPKIARAGANGVGSMSSFMTTIRPDGVLAGLFHDGKILRLLEGESFDSERWSEEIGFGAPLPFFDLAYVERQEDVLPAVLTRANGVTVRFIYPSGAGAFVKLGTSFSTCSRSSYIGVTCDACPVDSSCYIGNDSITDAQLFTRDGRLFAVFVATDIRRRMGYARSVIPIINVGCACTLEQREESAFADSLVVVEIVPKAQIEQPPTLIERMRVPMSKARTTGFVSFVTRSDGDLDVAVGRGLQRFGTSVREDPEHPYTYRILRLSTRSIP